MNIQKIADNYTKLVKDVENYNKNVEIVVVTKYVKDVEILKKLYELGIENIAENYSQEMEYKFNTLKNNGFSPDNYNWHFIGHLQKNKVKKVVPLSYMIQSLDSLELAEKINQQAKTLNKVQKCLVELKVSEEESKFGVKEEEIYNLIEKINSMDFKNLVICGLMTMAPYFEDPQLTRPYFKKAYNIFCEIRKKFPNFQILSMGMSNDYKIALEEGSNMLRIGNLLFKN